MPAAVAATLASRAACSCALVVPIIGSSGLQPQLQQPDSSSSLLDGFAQLSRATTCSCVLPTGCVSQEEGKILVRRAEETKRASAMHGLSR